MITSRRPARTASSAIAVIPGHLVAAIADRARVPALDRGMAQLLVVAAAAGAFGSVLLLITPERFFTLLVPALVGFATLLFACGKDIQTALASFAPDLSNWRAAALAPAAVYGGYFGAGLGVILLALLTVTGREDVRTVNTLKNLLATAVSLVAMTIFAAQNVVHWPSALTMLGGAVCGGFLGGRLIAILPASVVRRAVISIGIVMTIVYAWRYWLH